MKSRIGFFVTLVLALWATGAQAQQHRGRFDITPPIYQQFTVTDWVDVTRLALKSTIPGGISGTIYINFTPSVTPITLFGKVSKKDGGDASLVALGTFTTTSMNRDFADNTGDATWLKKYTLSLGDLSAGAKLDIDFIESPEYQRFKDKISGGALTSITGDFKVELSLKEGGAELANWAFTWNVPFADLNAAHISFSGEPVVTSPTPSWTVLYPAEAPDLPIEAWVVKVENNSVASALEGTRYITFKPTPGTGEAILLQYPATARPLTPGNYAIGGRSVVSTSSGMKNVPATPFEFKVEDPATSSGGNSGGGGGGGNNGGSNVPTVDPMVAVFGTSATSIPPDFVSKLTPIIRALMEQQGWTPTSMRYNGRTITATELIAQNVLTSFGSNWNIYLLQ